MVGKRQTRLAGLNERVLGLYAGGVSVRDVARHLIELYATEIGHDTISRVTTPCSRTSLEGVLRGDRHDPGR